MPAKNKIADVLTYFEYSKLSYFEISKLQTFNVKTFGELHLKQPTTYFEEKNNFFTPGKGT